MLRDAKEMFCHSPPLFHSLAYLHVLICLHITSVAPCGGALTPEQIPSVDLRFLFGTVSQGRYLYNTGDVEHISKATAGAVVNTVHQNTSPD